MSGERKAACWVSALRPVTFEVPEDFPTADKTSIRPPITLPNPMPVP
jgi:hypothetical protein